MVPSALFVNDNFVTLSFSFVILNDRQKEAVQLHVVDFLN